jgi:hypothetical protein
MDTEPRSHLGDRRGGTDECGGARLLCPEIQLHQPAFDALETLQR